MCFERDAQADMRSVREMAQRLRHRGPDGERILDGGWFGLAFRRLSVIDVTDAGMQPFRTDDGRVLSMCNGEIYNHAFLRRLLEARGYRFRSACDAEVVLYAYDAFGDAFVDVLEGMFAIAIVDTQRRRLVLARDRVGIKPLYYSADEHRVAFASELDALLADASVPRVIDTVALNLYFVHACVPSPRTIYRGVHKLDPGEIASWDLERRADSMRRRRYWRLRFSPDRERPFDSFRDELDAWVTESVREHLQSDVPLGTFLSGGIDSSSVLGKVVRASDASVRTITIGFDDAVEDERAVARELARRWKLDAFEGSVGMEGIAAMPEVASTWGEPFGDTSAIPMLAASRLASEQGLKVMLSGDGGDELFSGYLDHATLRTLLHPVRSARRPRRLARALRRRVHGALLGSIDGVPLWLDRAMVRTPLHTRFGRGVLRQHLQVPLEQIVAEHEPLRSLVHDLDPVDAHFTATFNQYLQNDILTKVDQATSRFGLEARVPLLDRRVVELAARIPYAMKLVPARSKHIFIEAMGDDLPASVVAHPKRGFGIPFSMLRRREWRADLRAMLARSPAIRTVLDGSTIEAWPDLTVWRALSVAYWLEARPEVRLP